MRVSKANKSAAGRQSSGLGTDSSEYEVKLSPLKRLASELVGIRKYHFQRREFPELEVELPFPNYEHC